MSWSLNGKMFYSFHPFLINKCVIFSGGGKGIRKVMCEEEWGLAYEQVLAEIPGSPIFVMKLAKR